MGTPGPRAIVPRRPGALAVLFVGAVELFALTTALPWPIALLVGGCGAGAAVALRARAYGGGTGTAAVVALLVLGLLAVSAPDVSTAGVTGGLSVLAFLLWLADEPGRVSGGPRRALPAVGVAGLAFAVAWVSAFLLPTTRVPTGVIAALLVGVILLATALLARPELLDLEPALSVAPSGPEPVPPR